MRPVPKQLRRCWEEWLAVQITPALLQNLKSPLIENEDEYVIQGYTYAVSHLPLCAWVS